MTITSSGCFPWSCCGPAALGDVAGQQAMAASHALGFCGVADGTGSRGGSAGAGSYLGRSFSNGVVVGDVQVDVSFRGCHYRRRYCYLYKPRSKNALGGPRTVLGHVWPSSSQLHDTQIGRSEIHSKKLFVSAYLKNASFWSASSVHGYARVHTSINIYIYICIDTIACRSLL